MDLRVVFLHGPAASGKHTIGQLLAAELALPLLHNHLAVDPALTLFGFGTPPFQRLRAAIWRAAFTEAAAAQQSFIFTFHPEASVDPALIDELRHIIATAGGRIDFIELQCSHAVVLQRLGSDSRRRYGKLTDAALYESIAAQGGFDFPPLPAPLLRVDTTTQSAQQAAAAIAAALRAGA
jgi:gluconate kinase